MHEVIPAFLQHTLVCLLVTKLSEMLSEHPKMEYFVNGKPVDEPTLCPFTNEQMLMHCVQTIQTQCTHQESSANQGSKLVMVGTHRDLAGQCLESAEEAPVSLTLIGAFSHFEVYVNAPYDVCHCLCLSISKPFSEAFRKQQRPFKYKYLVPKPFSANMGTTKHTLLSQQLYLTTGNVNMSKT